MPIQEEQLSLNSQKNKSKPNIYLKIKNVITLASKENVLLSIKTPKEIDLKKTSRLSITGWAIGKKHPISQIGIFYKNRLIKIINVNGQRPDVLKVFPSYSWAENSGINTNIQIPQLKGSFEILLRGLEEDNTYIDLAKIQGKIEERKPCILDKREQNSINPPHYLGSKTKLKALVHIGFHKTGSSSIQVSLEQSKFILANNGFIYPFLKVKNQHWPLCVQFLPKAENHYLIREKGFANQTELNKWLEEINLELDEQIATFKGHTCILSSEDFSAIPAHKLTEFRSFLAQRFDSTKIVVYVRAAEKTYSSLIQQLAKGGNVLLKNLPLPNNFKGALKKKLLEGYLKEFGQENISVIKFAPESLYEGDVVKDFQQRFLIKEDREAINLNSIKVNESITGAGVIFLFLLSQKIPKYIDNRMNPKWRAIRKVILNIQPSKNLPKLKIPAQWEEIIKQNYQEEYLWLEDTFFDGVRGIFSSPLTSSTALEAKKVTREDLEAWLINYLTQPAWKQINKHLKQANVLSPEELSELSNFFHLQLFTEEPLNQRKKIIIN